MLSLNLPTRSSALPRLRRAVCDWACERGIEPFPLTLIAVELSANGIEAAGPDGNVELVVRAVGPEVEIRVVDDGPGFDGPFENGPGASLPPVSNERGRGLYLVRQLSRQLHVGRSNGRTIVRAVVSATAEGARSGTEQGPVASSGPDPRWAPDPGRSAPQASAG